MRTVDTAKIDNSAIIIGISFATLFPILSVCYGYRDGLSSKESIDKGMLMSLFYSTIIGALYAAHATKEKIADKAAGVFGRKKTNSEEAVVTSEALQPTS